MAALAALPACRSEPSRNAASLRYPVHPGIAATVFWVGEPASADNDYIDNDASAWDGAWREHFGGEDTPGARQHGGSWPAAFRPKQNPYYLALPYGEFTESGAVRPDARRIYWYDPSHQPGTAGSALRGRWVRISKGDRTAYAQWADVGPFRTDDVDYVFGTAKPADGRAGIDLSPAVAGYLRVPGRAAVTWRFADAAEVPDGPWTEIVTPVDRPAAGDRGD